MPAGQPTKYKKEFNELARKHCLLGATDAQLADLFNVTETTINNWKTEHPKFFESIKEGKDKADAVIADSLFNRAKGYSHPDTHISNYQGEITVTDITKHYPPDATSAIFWLKNRQKDNWRDKTETDQNIKVDGLTDLLAEIADTRKPPNERDK